MTEVFEGLLSLDQMGTHVAHKFTVPEGVGTLRFDFTHNPRHPGVGSIPHQLSISVYGPYGARGTRHNNKDQSPIISTHWASPGYQFGKVEAGEWEVEIDVHRVLPPGNVSYRLTVDWTEDTAGAPLAETLPDISGKTKRRGPGWYIGDLHGHSFHSDGDFSPAEYLSVAHGRCYDFVSLTDHNTFSAVPELKLLAGDLLTVIGGVELTTFNGHAVALGLDGWTEWRVKDGNTMSGIAKDIQASGALYIIAHPKSEGHPFCTGCRWAYSDMLPGPARLVEIWNSAWVGRGNNEQAVQLFYQWLNTGLRMIATSGTDTHRLMPDHFRIPQYHVFAEDNTEQELFKAIKQGHSYVTCGPTLSFVAFAKDGSKAMMGDILPPGPLDLRCGWKSGASAKPLKARLISQGKIAKSWDCAGQSTATMKVEAADKQWFVLELRDAEGDLYALSNPIFVAKNPEDWI
jgi:hypothetical protein